MTESLVTCERSEQTFVIRLNRPARHNALVPGLMQDLLGALADERSRDAAAVILAAEGRSFSTGGDLLGFWEQREDIAAYAHELVGLLNEVVLAIYTHPTPVAAAVQGQVTGGSLGLLLAADRVFMKPEVNITPWYSEVGFSPDGGWTALLPDIIGRQRTSHWLSTNASASAEECLDMGITHEIADDVVEAARDWTRQITGKSVKSIRSTRMLLSSGSTEVGERLETERMAFVQQVQTREAITGIARFLGKDIPEETT
jgi:2-(1,2-epoxy-1,2-dihydrophenyl)acetyl-CoA isomerase